RTCASRIAQPDRRIDTVEQLDAHELHRVLRTWDGLDDDHVFGIAVNLRRAHVCASSPGQPCSANANRRQGDSAVAQALVALATRNEGCPEPPRRITLPGLRAP